MSPSSGHDRSGYLIISIGRWGDSHRPVPQTGAEQPDWLCCPLRLTVWGGEPAAGGLTPSEPLCFSGSREGGIPSLAARPRGERQSPRPGPAHRLPMDRGWEGGLLVWVLQQLEQASPDEKVMTAVDDVFVLCSHTRLYIASEKVVLVRWRECWAGILGV